MPYKRYGGAQEEAQGVQVSPLDPSHRFLPGVDHLVAAASVAHTSASGGCWQAEALYFPSGHSGSWPAGGRHLGAKSVRLAQTMQVGPCIPVGIQL